MVDETAMAVLRQWIASPFEVLSVRQNLSRQLLSEGCYSPSTPNVGLRRCPLGFYVLQYLGRQACCSGGCGTSDEGSTNKGLISLAAAADATGVDSTAPDSAAASEFFDRVLDQAVGAENLFRITITSFLDAYNFDVRRVMKCCTHHVLPSGHVIPFCAYNVLYRERDHRFMIRPEEPLLKLGKGRVAAAINWDALPWILNAPRAGFPPRWNASRGCRSGHCGGSVHPKAHTDTDPDLW